jgi:hypothetical protein
MTARARTTRTTAASQKAEPAPQPAAANGYHYYHRRPWGVPILIIVILIILFGLFASWAGWRYDRNGHLGFNGDMRRPYGQMTPGYSSGSNGIYNNEIRLQGVVTAVNGTEFTVAGNGSSNTVQTDSTTQYQNGSGVAVNDSVIVYGTINNGMFTAKTVVINP